MELIYEKYPGIEKHVNNLHLKYKDDAGYDLQIFGAIETPSLSDDIPPLFYDKITLHKNRSYKIFCGLRIYISQNFFGLIVPRSSSRDKDIIAHSIWDSGYTGWVAPTITIIRDVEFGFGERILQLILIPLAIKPEISEGDVGSLITPRMAKGYGSTGKFS